MGDMKGDFDALKDIQRTRAQTRVAEFESKRADIEAAIREVASEQRGEVSFDVDESGTFNVRLVSHKGPLRTRGGSRATIQYYPTKGTWQVKGKMHKHHTGPDAFLSWVLTAMRKTL